SHCSDRSYSLSQDNLFTLKCRVGSDDCRLRLPRCRSLHDSPLEGTRFEPSVPRHTTNISKAASWRPLPDPPRREGRRDRDTETGQNARVFRSTKRSNPSLSTAEPANPTVPRKPVMPSTQQAKPSIWGRTSACECISSRTLRRFPRGYSQTRIIDSLV